MEFKHWVLALRHTRYTFFLWGCCQPLFAQPKVRKGEKVPSGGKIVSNVFLFALKILSNLTPSWSYMLATNTAKRGICKVQGSWQCLIHWSWVKQCMFNMFQCRCHCGQFVGHSTQDSNMRLSSRIEKIFMKILSIKQCRTIIAQYLQNQCHNQRS